MRFQKPVTPLTGFSRPAAAYMLPISDGSTNQFTVPMKIPRTSPMIGPIPCPVCSFNSRNTW